MLGGARWVRGNPKINLRAVADVAYTHDLSLVVDNTIATPYLIKPFELPTRQSVRQRRRSCTLVVRAAFSPSSSQAASTAFQVNRASASRP